MSHTLYISKFDLVSPEKIWSYLLFPFHSISQIQQEVDLYLCWFRLDLQQYVLDPHQTFLQSSKSYLLNRMSIGMKILLLYRLISEIRYVGSIIKLHIKYDLIIFANCNFIYNFNEIDDYFMKSVITFKTLLSSI